MLQQQIKDVPGAVDVFMQQVVNAPKLNIKVDRLKAQEIGLTAKDVSDNVLLSLSGSGQVAPNFWLDPKTGVEYPVIVQVPQYRLHSLDTLDRTAVTAAVPGASDQLLRNVSETERQVSPLTVSHYNALPVMDVFANVEQRDLGGVASDVQKIVKKNSQHLPPGVRDRAERPGADDEHILREPGDRDRRGGGVCVSADGDEFPVVDHSLHHSHGPSGSLRGHRMDAVSHADHFQRALA